MPESGGESELLRTFLADRDVPCPHCAYNLRSLTGVTCPECGEKLMLGVHMVEPKQAAPIVGLIGLAIGAGFSGFLLIYALLNLQTSERIWWRFVAITGIGVVTLGFGLLVWLANWRRIRRLSAATRWSLVAMCWLLSLMVLIAFVVYID